MNDAHDFRVQLDFNIQVAEGLDGIFQDDLSFVDFDLMILLQCVCDILSGDGAIQLTLVGTARNFD